MEKKKPHYDLDGIKAELGSPGTMRATRTAMRGGQAAGLNRHEMAAIVAGLERRDFYKSMTSHADHKVWQDVYRPQVEDLDLYVKVTKNEEGFLLLSFKEAD